MRGPSADEMAAPPACLKRMSGPPRVPTIPSCYLSDTSLRSVRRRTVPDGAAAPLSGMAAREAAMASDRAPASLAALSEDERQRAMARFAVLQPHLERDVPLTRAAADAGTPLRTAQRG